MTASRYALRGQVEHGGHLGVFLAELKADEGFSGPRGMDHTGFAGFEQHGASRFISLPIVRKKRYGHIFFSSLLRLYTFMMNIYFVNVLCSGLFSFRYHFRNVLVATFSRLDASRAEMMLSLYIPAIAV